MYGFYMKVITKLFKLQTFTSFRGSGLGMHSGRLLPPVDSIEFNYKARLEPLCMHSQCGHWERDKRMYAHCINVLYVFRAVLYWQLSCNNFEIMVLKDLRCHIYGISAGVDPGNEKSDHIHADE